MDELKFCRICLNVGVKLYREDEFNLQNYFEGIMNSASICRGFQANFCYECAAILWKLNKFKEKCESGQRILNYLMLKGPITHAAISTINRTEYKLESALSRVVQNHKVATFDVNEDGSDATEINNITYIITVKQEPKIQEFFPFEHNFVDETDDVNDCDIGDFKYAPFTESDDEVLKLKVVSVPKVKKSELKKRKLDKALKTKRRKAFNRSLKLKKKEIEIEDDIKPKEKVKFAKQKAAGRKFDTEKWKIIHLSEEEMCREYRKRMDNPNYQNSLHYCEHCMKNFTCEETLKRHMRVHSEDKGKHECFLCKRRFNWEARLRSHMKTHQIRYHCLRCPEVCISSTSAITHEKIHEGFIYQCKHCDAKFIKMSSYYTHMRELHRSEHLCATCGASFVSDFGLHQHKKSKHPEELLSTKSAEHMNKHTDTYCDKCDINFKSLQAFEEHKNNSALHVEDTESEKSQKVKPKLYKAGMCPIKNAKDQFPCGQCEEIFLSKAACEKHRGKTHGTIKTLNQKRYICEICGASLAPGSIKDHKNRHIKDKLFPCGTCGKVFKSAPNRSRHLRTHTGEKPYSCKLCDKRFTQRQNAQLHHRKYHMKLPAKRADRIYKESTGL